MAEEKHDWSARTPDLFWTGALLGTANNVRHRFVHCVRDQPRNGLLAARPVTWSEFKSVKLADGRVKKSVAAADLRELTRHVRALFMTGHSWSSALKRIAVAGPALVMPQPALFEDLASLALAECGPRCGYAYDPNSSAMCDDLQRIAGAPEHEAAERADASTKLIRKEFSLESTAAYMLGTLREVGAGQDLRSLTPTELGRLGWVEADCAWLRQRYRLRLEEAGLLWQTENWMGPDCRFRDHAPYLASVAL